MINFSSLLEKSNESDQYDIILLQGIGKDRSDLFLRPPNLFYCTVIAYTIIASMLLSSILGSIVYKLIIPRPKSQTAYIIGYGVMVPFLLYLPFLSMDYFDIRQKHLRSFFVTIVVYWLFRTIEAIHGFTPPGSKVNLISYLAYFCTISEIKYQPETNNTVPATMRNILRKILRLLVLFLGVGLYSSILYHFDFLPFGVNVQPNSLDHTVFDMLSYRHMLNNYCGALLLQGYLQLLGVVTDLITNLVFQVETIEAMKNAMFEARSPSDFWGRKWNIVIHNMLKRAVFKPVREHYSKMMAMICTFLASGLFHEWILAVTFTINRNEKDENGYCDHCYYPNTYGKHLMFFLWNGMLIGIEIIVVKRFPLFHYLGKTLPPLLRSFMVLMTALPVGHLFLGDLIIAKFFHHSQIIFPTLLIKTSQ